MLLMAEPNVLLLDEPTNDLDIETLTELEDLLDGWPGSLVVVSHDRYFLERVTDHVVALLGGKLSFLAGGVTEYLERLEREAAVAPGPERSADTRRRTGGRRIDRGAAARWPEGAHQAGASARPDHGQEAELTAALAEHASDYPEADRARRQLRAAQDGTGQHGGALAHRWPRSSPSERWPGGSVNGGPRWRASNGASKIRSSAARSRCCRASSPVSNSRSLRQQVGEGGVDGGQAAAGQGDQDASLVLRIGLPADQSGVGQPVYPVRHGARCHERGAEQRAGAQLIRRALPAQRGQDIELPGFKPVRGERRPPCPVQVPGQPGDPAEHLQWFDVEVGPLGTPACRPGHPPRRSPGA